MSVCNNPSDSLLEKRMDRNFLNFALMIASGLSVSLCAPRVNAQTVPPHTVRIAPVPRVNTDSSWYPQAILKRRGTIQRFDAQFLTLRSPIDGSDENFSARRVISIDVANQPDDEKNAVALYDSEKFSDAVMALINSITSDQNPSARPPVWRQQWLSMLAADAAWRSHRAKISLELISQLDQRPLAPMVISRLPIQWTSIPRDRATIAIQAAQEKIGSGSPAVKLVCASWLLQSPSMRNDAIETLQRLSSDQSRIELAMLAETVRWRAATPVEVTENWRDWEQKINRMPLVLQTGPLRSLAEKMEAAGLAKHAKRIKLSVELLKMK